MSRFADVTTNTPHGPRPVPEGHIPADDSPPPKDLRSKLLIWGGVGLALTVGALAARAAASAVSGDDDDQPLRRPVQGPRQRYAPRYASMGPETRARMRSRAQADFVDYEDRAAELRAAAQRTRRRRRAQQARQSEGFGDGIGTAARNIVALIGAAGTALEGFRAVSANSDEIIRNFGDAADRLQEFLGTRSADEPKPSDSTEGDAERYTKARMSDEDRRTRNL